MSGFPGFRSGTWWKAAVALFGYFLIASIIVDGAKSGDSSKVFLGAFLFSVVVLAADGWGIRRRLPGFRSSSRAAATITWIVYVVTASLINLPLLEASRTPQPGPVAAPATTGSPQANGWTWVIAALALGGVLVLVRRGQSQVAGYHPSTRTNLEALYDTGEATVHLCDWNVISPGANARWDPAKGRFTRMSDQVSFSVSFRETQRVPIKLETVTFALTQERLYLVQFGGSWGGYRGGLGGGPFEVKWFKAISLANINRWSFESMKTTKGVLTGYRFSFESNVGDWVRNFGAIWWATPEVAGPFIEQFKAAMARFAATAGPVDVAGQLRALQALVDDGVITKEDMDRAKDLFLGRGPDQRQVMERSLRSLYDLRKAGVLNEIEFGIKKRDILATTK